ncbi:MAG: LPS export ABC transporter permease LptG [Alphaproteobacteria bacterium]|jgi:lipopolysaccharide export system permease protein|nr:LPS export ABC transporter permease LptG [Alphaproteobacteria bacterium]
MWPGPTLSVYLGRQYLAGAALVLGVLLGLVLLIDVVELLRRAWVRDSIGIWLIIEMAILKLPVMAQKVLPFAMLFGGMLAFLRLTRTHQLVVARAAGVSVWQFLLPAIFIALALGLFMVAVFNPLASATTSRYETLEAKFLHGRPSMLAVSSSGLWLRQADAVGQSVIHARRVSQEGVELSDVIIFLYEGSDHFVGRIDAARAVLRPGHWQLSQAMITGPKRPAERHADYTLRTSLTLGQIQDSFAPPETMSFWDLPGFIKTLERAGFSALRHRLHWHSLLSGPLLLFAMVLIAATFSLRLTRHGGTGLLILGGSLAGFLLYFLSDVMLALGLSGGLPVVLAAWAPAGISTLLGLAMMFHLEDG